MISPLKDNGSNVVQVLHQTNDGRFLLAIVQADSSVPLSAGRFAWP